MGKIILPSSRTSKIATHPFREGVMALIRQHFAPSIADNFLLYLEKEIYNKESIHIWKQDRDNRLIMEVRYKLPNDTSEYICDLASWWSKLECEVWLLKHITDKVKVGKIGKDWIMDKGNISQDVLSGKYETPDEKPNG